MSASITENGPYSIETRISAGSITDPVTGELYDIDPYEEDRGGIIEVDRADSAKYIVEGNHGCEYVNSGPSEKAIKVAQKEAHDFAESELVLAFAKKRGKTLGTENLNPADGFDPKTDSPNNGVKIRLRQTYHDLLDAGKEAEAEYLRALPTVGRQKECMRFLQERGAL